MSPSQCPLCRRRKGRRACPAKGVLICAQCCGTKRLVEIACPADCVYLSGDHAHGWENEAQRRRDARRIFPHLQALSEPQQQLVFALILHVAALRSSRRDLDDAQLAQALSALRRTLETRSHGILYEHPAADLRAQAVVHELQAFLDSGGDEGQPLAADSELVPAVSAFADALAGTAGEGAGPTAFLETLSRIVGAQPPQPSGGRLIVEP